MLRVQPIISTVHYIPNNIFNIYHHHLFHPITKQTKKNKKLSALTKQTESEKNCIVLSVFGPITEITRVGTLIVATIYL